MTITTARFNASNWESISKDAHTAIFGEVRPDTLNRHHFVVVVFGDKKIGGYFTCLEQDSETVYIQYGGVFPNFKESIYVLRGYAEMLKDLAVDFKRAWTRIENTNIPMLKMALKMGFVIMGTYFFNGKLFLELTKEFGG